MALLQLHGCWKSQLSLLKNGLEETLLTSTMTVNSTGKILGSHPDNMPIDGRCSRCKLPRKFVSWLCINILRSHVSPTETFHVVSVSLVVVIR